MTKIRIKLVKSKIGSTKTQKRTLEALGLKKVSSEAVQNATPQIMGMVSKVNHLITVEEVKE